MNLKKLFLIAAMTFSSAVNATDRQAPEFVLEGLKGTIDLSSYQNQVVYVDFWASWCGPCQDSFPWMNDMQAKYKSEGLRFIAINLDRERAKADKFLADMPVNIDIAFDATGKTPKQYEVFGMPSAYIIGRDGTILYSHIGFETNKVKLYEKHIQSALAAQ